MARKATVVLPLMDVTPGTRIPRVHALWGHVALRAELLEKRLGKASDLAARRRLIEAALRESARQAADILAGELLTLGAKPDELGRTVVDREDVSRTVLGVRDELRKKVPTRRPEKGR